MDPSESHLASECKKGTQRMRGHNWSADQTTIMLNLLREEQVTQRVTSQGSFTKQVWNRLAQILSSQSEPNRTGNELQRRWKTLKIEFYDYKSCAEKSGWGWDAVLRIPIAPDESCWEDLKKFNPKLYKFKSKSFQWYNVMNELCGSNIVTGNYAMSGAASNEQLQDNISKSDSSDSDANAVQELSDFDIRAFKNTMEGNYNFSFENSIGEGNEVSSKGKKSKGDPSHSNNNNDNNSSILLLIEESRERRMLTEEMKNKGKKIVEKLIKVKRDQGLSSQTFCILQEILKNDLSKEIFMAYEDDDLIEWINEMITYHSLAKS
ncbi:Myb/SANT-like DNA-binding domain-containing protein [Carex littledalei]|uniref:Myb/SANT-like DNA-binding domain-containing protein n=1 Tax=Carex littledalei TaxID=544730 RepID=A0A833R093_9POAL|nr:Myb/SANT-like DNA-binding domain-containing protein [Carex littledalei]